VNNNIYGGIFGFYNNTYPEVLFIQGITKYLIPTLISIFLPEYDKLLPRLNNILNEPIETLARNLGVKRILVAPIGTQGNILEKYFGYVKTSEIYYPCYNILGRRVVEQNPEHFTRYVKYLLTDCLIIPDII
jgi:hypothetical protein